MSGQRFVCIEHGMKGHYACLCDDAGPIISSDGYADINDAITDGIMIAEAEMCEFIYPGVLNINTKSVEKH